MKTPRSFLTRSTLNAKSTLRTATSQKLHCVISAVVRTLMATTKFQSLTAATKSQTLVSAMTVGAFNALTTAAMLTVNTAAILNATGATTGEWLRRRKSRQPGMLSFQI